jgi:hypothetical protein
MANGKIEEMQNGIIRAAMRWAVAGDNHRELLDVTQAYIYWLDEQARCDNLSRQIRQQLDRTLGPLYGLLSPTVTRPAEMHQLLLSEINESRRESRGLQPGDAISHPDQKSAIPIMAEESTPSLLRILRVQQCSHKSRWPK